ncbi:MAG: hypothetical protein IPL10_05625 [Bacteroidetes bacterium]|nr:hypothetical protein [Bacteroidota bacterium]
MSFNVKFWLKLSLVNLLIVAMLGVLMRYKIGFDFPYFSQKNIQHAHSHFAFAGWITQALYVLMIHFIIKKNQFLDTKNYNRILVANLICSYGMLFSFSYQGYSALSIDLSTITIVIACFFAFFYFKDLENVDDSNPSKPWFKAALLFNIISSVGTFYLAYIMASRNFNEHWYLASVYFYLHFQYNGFFIFTCLGLFFSECNAIFPLFKYDKFFFKLFCISLIPAYFLSTLWAKLPIWLYIIVVIAAFVQVIAWIKIIKAIKIALKAGTTLNKFQTYLFLFVGISFSIKLLLQLGSTIPALSDLAFGFRPIVIAYLHLVLLAVISLFILSYLYTFKLIEVNKLTTVAFSFFVVGIFLNELVLAIQGVAAFGYIVVKYVNEILFGISLILLLGALLIVFSQSKQK